MSRYAGDELFLFARAVRWKRYWSRHLAGYVRGRVLEVGAGIGSNIAYLSGHATEWVALEQDAALLARVPAACNGVPVRRLCGTVDAVAAAPRFDAVVYIDVLEHIEDDRGEVARASALLRPGGHLLVLAPAWERLRSPFDDALGHFRRYDRAGLRRLTPPGMTPIRLRYLDSCGMLASLGNRLALRSHSPTEAQVALWDRVLVPLSRLVDPLLLHAVGKSVVCVWRKESA